MLKILIVDDEIKIREVVKEYAKVSNYECDEASNGMDAINSKPMIMVLISNIEAINYISNSKNLMNVYSLMISKYKAMKCMVVFGNIPDETISYSAELLKKIKDDKNAFVFTNLSEHKVFDIPSGFIRQNKKSLESTQGFYVKESEVYKIRFAKEG